MKLDRHIGDSVTPVIPPAERAPASRVPDDALLDAARTCVLAAGVRRTTLTDIARTAGVSRMTLYRRFPDVRSVLAALMTREFGALLHRVGATIDESRPARARLVELAVSAVGVLVADPLLRTVLDRDAALLLPYVTERLGSTQRLAEAGLTALVADGHADGSVRRAEPTAQVRALLLTVQSFVLAWRPATRGVPGDALLAELRHLLDRSLAP
ncbi:TetR/AcrR family transcriptional regulator [Saccharomonospora piscinae]|uniref:TetR family transcriptional regulator n=1 Tax=Saccharomonospora piscinae TaxID=687388 RepID=A0A1V9A6L1_SACPI|nr:TetR/AcrR family transcriptional regulator [Saccharomonospora piscinae]OQO92666.1 TetR family transcriptional regulator [Saccharomonospora piscinae]TLW91628.1 TetR/AcrR family transcriptional regulator [Saccharomonospora piscinae]